ncbi:GntR family transcriptional regulator [Curtobacterium sp. S6]|uniref:GntR family transcriptional regulator n=1 Tax=Curtobacterium sp. S6 TaxID=1479623 RepID=UPI0004AB9512|nr:GntR family transcriptional regulator [Curtobacterium sp. S6]
METTHRGVAAALEKSFRQNIADGTWPEGQPLPSEAQLQRQFDASRGTVRKALSGLRAEGLIYGSQGRTPLVRRNTTEQSAQHLGSFTTWAESLGRVPGQKTLEVAKRPAGEEMAAALDVAPEDFVVWIRRLRFMDGKPSMLEESAFTMRAGEFLLSFDTDSGSIFRHLAAQGRGIYSAHHRIEAVAAPEGVARDLGCPAGTPILQDERTSFDAEGNILEFSRDSYLPGTVSLTIDNHYNSTPHLP